MPELSFERLTTPQPWPDAEVERLFRLRLIEGWDWDAIARELGRTPSGVKSKFKYQQHNQATRAPSVPGRESVPEGVLKEQARRVVACARDLAGAVFGDPPVGFSALDKRRAA